MVNKIYLLVLLSFLAIIQLYGQLLKSNGSPLYFDNLSVSNGLSQISVLSVYQDQQGYMWFGTRDGLNKYNGYDFRVFIHSPSNKQSISDNYVKCITGGKGDKLWIGTSNGLNCYDPSTGNFERFYISPERSMGSYNEINALYFDKQTEILYIGTYYGLFRYEEETGSLSIVKGLEDRIFCINKINERFYSGILKGLAIYDPITHTVERYSPFSSVDKNVSSNAIEIVYHDSKGKIWVGSSKKGLAIIDHNTHQITERVDMEGDSKFRYNEIRDIKEDSDGNLIIGTYDGLIIYNPATRNFSTYNQNESSLGGLSHYAIESIFVDRAGIIWVGTYSGGVNFSNKQGNRFQYYNPSQNNHVLGVINSMVQQGNEIWMGTEGGGLIVFDTKKRKYGYYPCSYGVGDSYKDNNVKSIMIDGETLYAGVYKGWLYKFDMRNRKFIGRIPNTEQSAIYAISKPEGNNGYLLGTYSSAGLKIYKEGVITAYNLPTTGGEPSNVSQISTLLADSIEDIYIGTRSGGLYHYNHGKMKHYSTENNSISGNKISIIYKDSRGTLLLGTADGGLNVFDRQTGTFTGIGREEGLADDKICSIVEDVYGSLWVITRIGISELDQEYRVKRTFDHTSGIRIHEFSTGSAIVTPDNTIYVGGDNGFISFNPDQLRENTCIPPIVIDNVLVNNKPINSYLSTNSGLDLRYNQANLTIEYSALNYIYSDQNHYAYKLEGVDRDWNYVENIRTVNYANLAPGKYVFKVMGSNNDGYWNEEGISLKITINPPFWETGWAFLLYFVLITGILTAILWYYRQQQRLRQQVALKQQEEELYKARIDLFTNFSHELRTPLTLISGPIEDVLLANDPQRINLNKLRMIHGNTQRLLLLVDQLMTFRKQESGGLSLRVAKGDFVGFVREMELAFSELAHNRNISLTLNIEKISDNGVWYDRSLFEKVFMNLLSNAFNYTPNGGKIAIRLMGVDKKSLPYIPKYAAKELYQNVDQYLMIVVEDNGAGLNTEDLERIFDPFYQSKGSKGGTGLGLSLSKGIVEQHKGALWAESGKEPGTKFFIIIPTGNDHFRDNEMIVDYHDSEDIVRYNIEPKEEDCANMIKTLPDKKEHTILIVEDNTELRQYIKSALNPYYKVIEAENGEEGKIHAISSMPSLILSDIMMPVMDGLRMCRDLKEDLRTSHIPVILLTARSFLLQMKEGLELGADDYITKPFNTALLLLKIGNIIASRENLKNLYGKRLSMENMGVDVISSDDRFLQKLNSVVEKNITDPNLNIKRFCDEIGMSRASLYRKLIATTNMSPAKYIQSVRLHLASKMLDKTDMSVSDISDAVGFNSLIHFSSSFRKQYGVPPSKYGNRSEK